MDRADRPADALRRLEHVGRVQQGFDVAGMRVFQPSVRVDSTDWLMARLPALAIAMMRSPGFEKTWSLRKVETLSRPALVRVVRDHDQPVPHQHSAAIGHSQSLNSS